MAENEEKPHVAYCGVCGRRLTRPDSIAAGLGDVCLGKQIAAQAMRDGKSIIEARDAKGEIDNGNID